MMRSARRSTLTAFTGAALVACALFTGDVALAQDDVRKEIDELRKGQQQILQQLQELKQLVQAQPRPAPAAAAANVKDVVFNLGSNPVVGNDRAGLVFVEFTDYQCPYCGRFARDTHPQIKKDFVDTGKIRYATLDMPLAFHKQAAKAAEATHCAEDQGKFWEMSQRLFEHQTALEPYKAHAEALGLDVPKFEECMSSGRHSAAVRKDMAEAQKAGVTGTPAFLLAAADPADKTKVKGIALLRGAQPYDRFKSQIEQALSGLGK